MFLIRGRFHILKLFIHIANHQLYMYLIVYLVFYAGAVGRSIFLSTLTHFHYLNIMPCPQSINYHRDLPVQSKFLSRNKQVTGNNCGILMKNMSNQTQVAQLAWRVKKGTGGDKCNSLSENYLLRLKLLTEFFVQTKITAVIGMLNVLALSERCFANKYLKVLFSLDRYV